MIQFDEHRVLVKLLLVVSKFSFLWLGKKLIYFRLYIYLHYTTPQKKNGVVGSPLEPTNKLIFKKSRNEQFPIYAYIPNNPKKEMGWPFRSRNKQPPKRCAFVLTSRWRPGEVNGPNNEATGLPSSPSQGGKSMRGLGCRHMGDGDVF